MEKIFSDNLMSKNKYSILIVDDNSNNLFTLKTIINENVEADILEADSGENALKILLREDVDIIILDIQMRGLDGFETAKIIKSRKKTSDIPIIFLTAAYVSDEFQKYGFEIGAVDYLIKPIDEYLLINRINVYLKLIEKERNINIYLESEVQNKTKELVEANKAKDLFLANMSHELRTPLNGILGATQMLQTIPFESQTEDLVKIISISSKRMVSLVNNLLQVSVLEYARCDIEHSEISVKEIVTAVIDSYLVQTPKDDLKISCHIEEGVPKCIIGDSDKITQILLNLVGNAIKFTDKGFVKIEVGMSGNSTGSESGNVVEFRVEDSGIGIKDDDMERMFNSFVQLDSGYSKKYQGAGLGLTISQKLANLMGGNITATSEYGKGTKFVFSIGLEGRDKMTEDIVACTNLDNHKLAKNKRILVADDDKISQTVMNIYCKKLGFEVFLANNGQEALDMVQENEMDIVLMDIQMPNLSGIDVTKRIREKEKNIPKHTVIIALTAFALEGDREKFLEVGMDDYVSKPVNLESLGAMLNSFSDGINRRQKLSTST